MKDRKAWKNILQTRYRFIKDGILASFLAGVDCYDTRSELFQRLKDPKQFESFVFEKHKGDRIVWDTVLSRWEADPSLLADVRFYYLELANVIEQVLARVHVRNCELYTRLSSYCTSIRSVFALSILQDDPARYIGDKLVFPMLAAWKNECDREESSSPVFWVERAIQEL